LTSVSMDSQRIADLVWIFSIRLSFIPEIEGAQRQ